MGTDSSSFTLSSFGSLNVTNLGMVDNTGSTDLTNTCSLEAGQFSAYQFTVPPGTFSLEVSLSNQTGSPVMLLRADNQFTGGYDSYGNDGGPGSTWTDPSLINIANPAATNYTLMVQAVASGGDSSFDVRVHAIGPQAVPFDGGMATIADQAPNVWQYFIINVPADPNVLGWDLRLTNVTAAVGGTPYLFVCRDTPPSLNNPNFWNPATFSSWPSSYQWSVGYDWTGDYYNRGRHGRLCPIAGHGHGQPAPARHLLRGCDQHRRRQSDQLHPVEPGDREQPLHSCQPAGLYQRGGVQHRHCHRARQITIR